MNKLRFVIDTNILVSSILIASSLPDMALKKARIFGEILFSETTLQEIQEILERSKFDRYVSRVNRTEFIAKLKVECELINIIEKITICRDPKDDIAVTLIARYSPWDTRNLVSLRNQVS